MGHYVYIPHIPAPSHSPGPHNPGTSPPHSHSTAGSTPNPSGPQNGPSGTQVRLPPSGRDRDAPLSGWAWVPLCSVGLLAFVPFLWLALVRRRARYWVHFVFFLALAALELYLGNHVGGWLISWSFIPTFLGAMYGGSAATARAFQHNPRSRR
jgi:hypothetical protein